MSKTLQIIIGIAVIIISFSVFYYFVLFIPSLTSPSLTSPSVEQEQEEKEEQTQTEVDWFKGFEKNVELEKVYNDSQNLPYNHTLCIPVKRFLCNTSGCKNVEPKVFILLGGNSSEPTISRCDSMGCDTYDSIVDKSGDYKNIQPTEPKGFVFKMSYNTVDKKFVEVAILGLNAFVSYGYCMYDFEYKK